MQPFSMNPPGLESERGLLMMDDPHDDTPVHLDDHHRGRCRVRLVRGGCQPVLLSGRGLASGSSGWVDPSSSFLMIVSRYLGAASVRRFVGARV